MANTGIARIDSLWLDPAAPPLARDDADADAVGAVQDLLIGHGARLPGILETGHGKYGPQTEAAVRAFQEAHELPATGTVDEATLKALAQQPSPSPIAANSYVSLALDRTWSGFTKLVGLTAQFEAAGRFTARNRNTDRAGLSFGIIQWAQKPGRLNGLLRAFDAAQPDRFTEVFGAGSRALANGLIAHTAKAQGGVNALGHTTDPDFDLVNDAWNARFVEAGRDRIWQQVQLRAATAAFRYSLDQIRLVAPLARSERAIAFLLDLANQHGDGGTRNICSRCLAPGLSEPAFLLAVQNESVRRLKAQFGPDSPEMRSTLERRERFRTSPLLSDLEFGEQ